MEGNTADGQTAETGLGDGAAPLCDVRLPAMPKRVVVVAGPTASGKSALAAALAAACGGVVVNADAMQVYRDFRILTARPGPTEEARVPHRLYGVLGLAESCSAGRWRRMALAEIARAHEEGLLPVVCGGTGLYLKALTDGLSPIPSVPAAVRQAVRRRLGREGAPALHAVLAAVDPPLAARLHPHDAQRVARGLEVAEATGRRLSDWQRELPDGPPDGIEFVRVLVLPPRDALYRAIDARLLAMVAAGALDEVAAVRRAGYASDLPGMKALGLPQLLLHQEGALGLDEAVAAAQQATRRYAKRQMTWLRHQFIADIVIEEQFSENILSRIFSLIRR